MRVYNDGIEENSRYCRLCTADDDLTSHMISRAEPQISVDGGNTIGVDTKNLQRVWDSVCCLSSATGFIVTGQSNKTE